MWTGAPGVEKTSELGTFEVGWNAIFRNRSYRLGVDRVSRVHRDGTSQLMRPTIQFVPERSSAPLAGRSGSPERSAPKRPTRPVGVRCARVRSGRTPSGRHLHRGGRGRLVVRVCAASGGEPTPLSIPSQFGPGQFPSSPTISRTGNRLICEQREIWVLDIWRASGPHASGDGIFPAQFIASTWPERNPQFSPDGKRIAYSGGGTGNLEIWVCDEQGQACAQLTFMAPKAAQNPRWSPGGSEIAFDSGDGIYVVRSDGGSARALTVESSNEVLPSWSRDGQSD